MTKCKLVPMEPTLEMLDAAQLAWLDDPARRSSTLWKAMLAAAPEAELAQPVGWQPIETAPLDTMVLIFLPHNQGDYMFQAMKINQFGEDGIGWFVHGDDLLDDSPTHWMPLPEVPVSDNG